MDEQTSPASEPPITAPEPVATDSPAVVEPPQAEPAPLAETAETITPEPTAEELPETSTAQMGRNEPLPAPTVAPEIMTPSPAPTSPSPTQPPVAIPAPQTLGAVILAKARAIIQSRKQKKLEKIMALFTKQTSITNDQVEKLLHVSDATATRYLSHLEKERKIAQSGKTGHAVSYTKL